MVSGNLCRIASQELKEYLGFDIIIKNDNKNVKNRQNQSSWLPLFVALVKRLTEKQKTDVIQYDRKKNHLYSTQMFVTVLKTHYYVMK